MNKWHYFFILKQTQHQHNDYRSLLKVQKQLKSLNKHVENN